MIIGIDPGKTGGVVFLDLEGNVKEVIFGTALQDLVPSIQIRTPSFAYVEKAQAMPKNGAVSMFNYGQGFGEILGVLYALKVPFELVPPAKWSKVMLAGIPTSLEGKKRNALAATRLYPGFDLRASVRCKKPHEGLVDALLIAEYGRRTNTRGP